MKYAVIILSTLAFVFSGCAEKNIRLTKIILIGDSMLKGIDISQAHQISSLLIENDDSAYPDYRGKDLSSRFPAAQIVDRIDVGITISESLKSLNSELDNPAGRTLVIYAAGLNDVGNIFAGKISLEEGAKAITEGLEIIAEHFSQKRRFPDGVDLLLWNYQDYSDGVGFIPAENASEAFACKLWPKKFSDDSQLMLVVVAALEDALSLVTKKYRHVHLIDIHRMLLGHGAWFFLNDAPFYCDDDPSLWYNDDCIHFNERGSHQVRKLIWQKIETLYGKE